MGMRLQVSAVSLQELDMDTTNRVTANMCPCRDMIFLRETLDTWWRAEFGSRID